MPELKKPSEWDDATRGRYFTALTQAKKTINTAIAGLKVMRAHEGNAAKKAEIGQEILDLELDLRLIEEKWAAAELDSDRIAAPTPEQMQAFSRILADLEKQTKDNKAWKAVAALVVEVVGIINKIHPASA